MNDIIIIDGVKYKRVEEELELAKDPKQNPFNIADGELYYTICGNSAVGSYIYDDDDTDNERLSVANVCKDESLMKQRAMHEILDRLLWRASVQAGELDNPWNLNNAHYYIYYDSDLDSLKVDYKEGWKTQGTCYFPSEESVQAATDNIIKPFMAEHPDFVW